MFPGTHNATALTVCRYAGLARGTAQLAWLSLLFSPEGCPSPAGMETSARQWLPRYTRSFANLVARLESAGVTITRIDGPRGGEFHARYYATEGNQT